MFSNLSDDINESVITYPITDSSLSFSDYIKLCRSIIQDRRPDLRRPSADHARIIDANSPYELRPRNPVISGAKLKHGALLIHGLLDCPFSLRDLGERLKDNGVLCRSVLLPGHGTKPSDLLNVSYQDWVTTVRYGVESLRCEVDQIHLIGYSTGAALSIYHALEDKQIAGMVLLSPAIKIKTPATVLATWQYMQKWLGRSDQAWIYHENEIDYVKYKSISFNAVNQVTNLTKAIQDMHQQKKLTTPIFMTVSREDETISSDRAIDFFSTLNNQESRMLLYTSTDHRYPDQRIFPRVTDFPALGIKHFSHVSIPYAPSNPHYGQAGDYPFASHIDAPDYIYGAYSTIEQSSFDLLHKYGLTKKLRRDLTYNPDFDYMSEKITQFVLSKS